MNTPLHRRITGAVFAAILAGFLATPADARSQIRIVGSSTVFPFSTVVAEFFGRTTDFRTPVVESTGTGGGFKLFCAGVGEDRPDFVNASRAIKPSEIANCAANGVTDIVEIQIGYDGIVLANSAAAPVLEISLGQLWLALAKSVPDGSGGLMPNPNVRWSDIDPSLPNTEIQVMGPPPTSGTRDAFVELAMEGGCASFDWIVALKSSDKNRFKAICHSIREDGAFVEAGENDVLIIRKLEANPDAFGIFGFSFLDQNFDVIQGSSIGGVQPNFDDIAAGLYPVSRPLFMYAKPAHADLIPGLAEFIREFTEERTWGPDGYLSDRGLIPLPEIERGAVRDVARGLVAMAANP
ncbi:MAG: phosphate ABC transporter substrate-binding protein [Alphaproteobacteria bacterium]|jgi:phosphate transport system substrate-binding protein|nr:phosphate ABC transporter substrate-binding protein [Alphaproteobacteria bacterium]MBT5860078.1 phosphate ABC transporter substrate-binding protein [Alphaproteobacteria bacterium]